MGLNKGRHLWQRPKPKLLLFWTFAATMARPAVRFSEGFCHRCCRALLGLGTQDIHVSLTVFGLCSVFEFMISMSLVGFAAK